MESTSLFLCSDYRELLAAAIERRKMQSPITLKALAKDAGLQATYLTNVLRDRAHLNQDQLYALTSLLSLNRDEREFAFLLLDFDRANHPQRKKELSQKLEDFRKLNLKTSHHLESTPVYSNTEGDQTYYLDPNILLTHVFLRIPHYAKHPSRIAEELHMTDHRLQEILKFLEAHAFVHWDAKRKTYCVDRHTRHLDPDSPACRPHQTMMRLKSIERTAELSASQRYNISISYFANQNVRMKIQADFLQFLKRVDHWVTQSKDDDEVFQMNFDLFPWSSSTKDRVR